MEFTRHERDLESTAGAGDDLDYMHAQRSTLNRVFPFAYDASGKLVLRSEMSRRCEGPATSHPDSARERPQAVE